MSGPVRIQLRRTKGWRMPDNTVKVDRTTKWGNPLRIYLDDPYGPRVTGFDRHWYPTSGKVAQRFAVWAFRRWVKTELGRRQFPAEQLRGKNLACWCKPEQPCHADVLLELANAPDEAAP